MNTNAAAYIDRDLLDQESTMDGETAQSPGSKSMAQFRQLLGEMIELDARKKALKKELDAINKEYDQKESVAISYFAESGISSVSAAGKTFYVSKKLWASVPAEADKIKVSNIAIASGLEEFISLNAQKLSSYVREVVSTHQELFNNDGVIAASLDEIRAVIPEPLRDVIKISETVDIGIRAK